MNTFFIAKPGNTASDIHSALNTGFHLILIPGFYHLEATITIQYEDTVIIGLGMATSSQTVVSRPCSLMTWTVFLSAA
jgi:hypothetical protein